MGAAVPMFASCNFTKSCYSSWCYLIIISCLQKPFFARSADRHWNVLCFPLELKIFIHLGVYICLGLLKASCFVPSTSPLVKAYNRAKIETHYLVMVEGVEDAARIWTSSSISTHEIWNSSFTEYLWVPSCYSPFAMSSASFANSNHASATTLEILEFRIFEFSQHRSNPDILWWHHPRPNFASVIPAWPRPRSKCWHHRYPFQRQSHSFQ